MFAVQAVCENGSVYRQCVKAVCNRQCWTNIHQQQLPLLSGVAACILNFSLHILDSIFCTRIGELFKEKSRACHQTLFHTEVNFGLVHNASKPNKNFNLKFKHA